MLLKHPEWFRPPGLKAIWIEMLSVCKEEAGPEMLRHKVDEGIWPGAQDTVQ